MPGKLSAIAIAIAEMKSKMDRLCGTVEDPVSTAELSSILRLRGGMQESCDVVEAWMQDLAVHRSLITEGVDVDYSVSSIMEIMEDMIRYFEGCADEAEEKGRQLVECQQQLDSEGHGQDELRMEVQRLTVLLMDVKEKVGKLMVEDI